MRKANRNEPCPCGSGRKFKQCCGPALAGDRWPETPEALMRSRYSAFVSGEVAHLYRTTHPENEAVRGVDPDRYLRETLEYCRQMSFTGLTVHQTLAPDAEGVAQVLFTAAYEIGGKAGAFTELSDFLQVDGRWVYWRGKEQKEPGV